MKAHIIFIAFAFCAFSFGCKKDSSTIGDGLNFKTFNLPPDAVYSSQDNCFLVADYQTGRLAKIDGNGNLLWQRNDVFSSIDIKNQNSKEEQPIIISSQQNTCSFQFINDSIRGAQKYYHIVFTTVDNNGNILVKKNISTPKDSLDYNSVNFSNADAIALASGEFIYLVPNSFEYSTGTNLYHITVRKISASGNLIWEKKQSLKVAANTNNLDYNLKLYSNAAATFYIIQQYSSTNNRVSTYDASGNFISFKNINSQIVPNVSAYDNLLFNLSTINSILSPNNSDIIFTGSKGLVIDATSQSVNNWFIYKFNSAFGIIKSNYFGTSRFAGVSCINTRGNIVLVGYEYINTKSYFKASEFDGNTLEEISNNSYLETNNYAGLSCISNLDGTISVIATETFNNSTNPIHTIFFKLNADGSLIK